MGANNFEDEKHYVYVSSTVRFVMKYLQFIRLEDCYFLYIYIYLFYGFYVSMCDSMAYLNKKVLKNAENMFALQ